jgi:hypothetical protein
MPDNNLTDIKIALALLEKASTDNTNAQTKMTGELTELVITMRESNVRSDLMLDALVEQGDKNEITMKSHLDFAKPILLRSQRSQDNIDKMVTSIFSKGGLLIFTFILVAVGIALGIDPSSFKVK